MTALLNKIEDINCAVDDWVEVETMDNLFNTLGGILLFKYNYSVVFKKTVDPIILKIVDTFFERTIYENRYDMSFSRGLSGIGWLMLFLGKNAKIDIDQSFFEILDSVLERTVNKCIAEKDYDIFQGLIGINKYLLERNSNKTNQLIKKINIEILKMGIIENQFLSYKDNFHQENDTKNNKEIVNLGLAHGLPSIIYYFKELINRNIEIQSSTIAISKLVNYIERYKDIDGGSKRMSKSIYPSYIELYPASDKEVVICDSRLSWCYGDLGIGFTFYGVGMFLNNYNLVAKGLDTLRKSTLRKSQLETSIFDAGICHGAAGVAYIYNKMWKYTGEDIFRSATDYWMKRTLNYAIHNDGIAGYKTYRKLKTDTESHYVNDIGLLGGVTGIGLVLLNYITGDFTWDSCLMLNY